MVLEGGIIKTYQHHCTSKASGSVLLAQTL
jgi:hypothetical protein